MDEKKAQEYINILRRTDVFYDLSEAQLQMVAGVCSEAEYRMGEIIFEENSTGDELYVIARGEVEILVDPSLVQTTPGPGTGPVTIATLRSGQTFGEVALVDRGLRTASARCASRRTRLLVIPRERLIALCDSYPELGYRVMRNVAADLAFKIRGTDLLIREQLLWRPRPPA
ncbi:MAG TPA: cyclic nucleotide-binding domain-containing protein [Anaerolineales bacterium]|nr:cyclic nucleotide-binding domain-containing protein [Anaerolineae bacterium]HIQ01787.1 cyclic nucleotide-binding domain-containing protein [Anaerolineales bacterium]